MAANTFAMESMTLLVASMVDKDKKADIRLEAAIAKMWATEEAWRIVDDTMQIRGGRGYETADSLKARGEEPVAIERLMRDCRINTIFEGSSEIMRLFHAMLVHGPKLEREQVLLGRFVEIGAELFAILASCSRAQSLMKSDSTEQQNEVLHLADYFSSAARLRIERNFDGLTRNTD